MAAVSINSLPAAGEWTTNAFAVAVGDEVSAAAITAGKLVCTPGAEDNGAGYASVDFMVRVYGASANAGIDLNPSANTITIDVTSVNDAPAGADKTVTTLEDQAYTFATADFGFSDAHDHPANGLSTVRITSLPAAGALTNNGLAVAVGDEVSAAAITAGKLVFTPGADDNGAGYASFDFKVRDDGGTANGGIDLDPSANTITIDVTSVNDAPAGADKTVTTLEDQAYTFATADFGFSDTHDSPVNGLAAVKITSLPTNGSLTNNGVAVTVGEEVSAAAITANKLVFTPGADDNGAGYASFDFKVRDDGGTAFGG